MVFYAQLLRYRVGHSYVSVKKECNSDLFKIALNAFDYIVKHHKTNDDLQKRTQQKTYK